MLQGLIPGGETTILSPPQGSSYDWNVDVAAGTTMMFIIIDSQGHQGGSSDFLVVGSSDDATCLTGSSPTSTASLSPSSLTTTSATPTASVTVGAKVSIGAIAGTVLGGIITIVRVSIDRFCLGVLSHRSSSRLLLLRLGYFSLRNGGTIVVCLSMAKVSVLLVAVPDGSDL